MRTIPIGVKFVARRRVPIGLAPNLEVSLVVTPGDPAFLAPRTAGFYA